MRDLLFFTTENGVADLILKEVPYKQTAYIRILQARDEDLQALVEECVSFCRMVGAERIYASGHHGLQRWPLYTAVITMRGPARVDQEKLRSLFPVSEQTVSRWREVYNRRMSGVDNSATLEARDEEKILSSGGAYFVHDRGKLLGIGWMEDTKLLAMAATEPGAGELVMHSLMSLAEGSDMILEVASTNTKAIRLYERLGFIQVDLVSQWYDVRNF